MVTDPGSRYAWRQYFAQRDAAEQALLWSAELVEWLERFAVDEPYPTGLQDLIHLVRSRVSDEDVTIIRRFVAYQLSPLVLQSEDAEKRL